MIIQNTFKNAVITVLCTVFVFSAFNAEAQIKAIKKWPLEDFLTKQYGEFIARNTDTGGAWANESDRNGDGQFTFPQDVRQFVVVFDWTGYIDYLNNGAFGTETTGYVKERPFGNGISEFTIHIEANQALIYAWECSAIGFCGLDTTQNLVFGNTADDVLAGNGDPAFADIEMDLIMYGNTGEIPTFYLAFGNWFADPNPENLLPNFRQFHLKINGEGPLHEAFGEGVEYGDLGKLFWSKQGVNNTKPAQEGAIVDNNKGANEAYPSQGFYIKPIQ